MTHLSNAQRPFLLKRAVGVLRGRASLRVGVWAGLGVISFIWGSTFLAQEVGLRTVPPLLLGSARFLLAGSIILGWCRFNGTRWRRPTRGEWLAAFAVGAMLFLVSNGSVMWSQRRLPTGEVALLTATIPLWMATIDRVVFGNSLGRAAVLGLIAGFVGLALLIRPPGSGTADGLGVTLALLGAVTWAGGSLYARGARVPQWPLLAAGMEMLAGGALLAVGGLLIGEGRDLHLESISRGSILAILYLAGPGSLVFGVYLWLLKVTRASLVSTYAYIAPVVAVTLGWAVLAERLSPWDFIGGGIIIGSVGVLLRDPVGEGSEVSSARGARRSKWGKR